LRLLRAQQAGQHHQQEGSRTLDHGMASAVQGSELGSPGRPGL
jgi:hypothetical protein